MEKDSYGLKDKGVFMSEEYKTIKEGQLEGFILENFNEDALLEISYNRVFVPGRIVNIIDEENLYITLQLKGELLHQTVDINISDIKSEIVELRYTSNEKILVLSIVDD